MAVLFNDGSLEYLGFAGAVIPAPPITLACWVNADASVTQTLIGTGNSASGIGYLRLFITNDRFVVAQAQGDIVAGGGNLNATSSATITLGVWHHVAAVYTDLGAAGVAAYIDGGNKGTDSGGTGWENTGNWDVTSIGVLDRNSPVHYMSGHIAEAAIWNVALTDAEVARLAARLSPLFVRPESIVAHYRLTGVVAIQDLIGGYNMTAYNTPTTSEHPPMTYPSSVSYVQAVAAVSGVENAWYYMAQQEAVAS